jgi:Flp pilus assembly protein TadD
MPLGQGKRTTSPHIAVANLQGRIKSGDHAIANGKDQITPRLGLIDNLVDRSSVLGKVSDLDRIAALGTELGTLAPKDTDAFVYRATALSAVHEFEAASKMLDEAENAGAKPAVLKAKRASLQLATGKYEEACPAFEDLAKAGGPVHTPRTLQAVCIAQLGRIDEADKILADVEAAYTDVSPFVLAWIWFERGSMWERAGNEDKARTLYRAALDRLPGHAHAAAHLAQLVPPAEAEAVLKPALEVADDPELKAILGLAKERAAPGSGKALLDEAARSYDDLLAKHPLAFADHAGWFFLNARNDPARAAEVARKNLANRKTHEAYELALAALPAAGSSIEACEAADQALARAWAPKSLVELAAKAYEACGKPDKAAEARKR